MPTADSIAVDSIPSFKPEPERAYSRTVTRVIFGGFAVSKGRKIIQVLEYEGIHVICFLCGKVGHKMGECTIKARPSDTTTQPSQPAPPASGVARGIADEAEYGNWA